MRPDFHSRKQQEMNEVRHFAGRRATSTVTSGVPLAAICKAWRSGVSGKSTILRIPVQSGPRSCAIDVTLLPRAATSTHVADPSAIQ